MEVRDKSVFKGQVGGLPAEGAFERLSICLWSYPLTRQLLTRLPPSSWLAIYLFILIVPLNCAISKPTTKLFCLFVFDFVFSKWG